MEGKQIAGDGLAGMSKNQLYDIMHQMKTLTEQNKEQAKQILIQNPAMTRALFQAQIMLGMVQPPQALPTTPQTTSISPQPLADQQSMSNVRAAPTGQKQRRVERPSRTSSSNLQSKTIRPTTSQPRTVPSHSQQLQQPKNQATMSVPLSSQVPSITQVPQHTTKQPLVNHQAQIPSVSPQPQQHLQNIGSHYMPLQPPSQSPLHPQPKPSMPTIPHQGHSQLGQNVGGFHSQATFHTSPNPHAGLGPPLQQGQLQRPNQPLTSPNYQVPTGTDRAPNWIPEATTSQLQGPPLSFSGQVGPSNQPPRPQQPLTPELEKALLQQVMSLTPEQINLLPPDQRNQILQLQQMLRR